jgi:hypothetical protein
LPKSEPLCFYQVAYLRFEVGALHVVARLFDDVGPEKDRRMREEIAMRIEEAGRKPLSLPEQERSRAGSGSPRDRPSALSQASSEASSETACLSDLAQPCG